MRGHIPTSRFPAGIFGTLHSIFLAKIWYEIDNYTNVFPTGKIIPVSNTENLNLNFNDPAGRALDGQYLDNCFVDLTRDEKGFAFAEIFDRKMGIKIKVSATNENVIGIQAYAPKNSATVAIELVTHLPDPRKESLGQTRNRNEDLSSGRAFPLRLPNRSLARLAPFFYDGPDSGGHHRDGKNDHVLGYHKIHIRLSVGGHGGGGDK